MKSTNYLTFDTSVICKIIRNRCNINRNYVCPHVMIVDQDNTFMSSLRSYLFKRIRFKLKTVSTYNHQSLQAEHGIKSLSNILINCLMNLGDI